MDYDTCCRYVRSGALWVLLPVFVSCAIADKQILSLTGPDLPADTSVSAQPGYPAESAAVGARVRQPGPLKISPAEAVLLCLENNRALMVERLNPSIRQTFEQQERAVFDPVLEAQILAGRVEGERQARSGSETESHATTSAEGVISLEQYFPTGTTVSLQADTQVDHSSLYADDFYASRMGITLTQELLRGYGTGTNLARLKQARLDTRMSEFELRGFTESLAAQVERAYWDYALAQRQIEIVEQSLNVARQQLDETRELITVGRLAKSELAAVQAEVASQEQALIEARADRESIRLQLLRLLNPGGPGIWQRELVLVHRPTLPEIKIDDVETHVALSMRMRPLLNQARLEVLSGTLELVKTKNGLLPRLDLFITFGKSGYANAFGDSVADLRNRNYDALVGARLEYPFYNRQAKALHQRALLTREQARTALRNVSQLVEIDVRTAFIDVQRTRQQIAASSVTRRFDEEKLRIEAEKLRVGKSTSILVAQAQRDLLASRIGEVQALTGYLKALIELYRLEGSLLERRGIAAPGGLPVELNGDLSATD